MNNWIIQTTGLTHHYKELRAVNNVELSVPQGCVYGFLGPNGAGKTTTIRMLLGLITPSAGQVQLFGQDMADRTKRRGLLRRVGALVEMPALYPHLTAIENLEVTRRLVGSYPKHIDRVLTLVNLHNAAKRMVKGYSLGMKQRLGLALALLNEPEMLILDEPTNGLDPAGIHEIRDLIIRLSREYGITIFLSSHLLNEIEQMATHLGIISQGHMIYQGTIETLQAQRESHLTVGVGQLEKASEILTQSGWQVLTVNGHLTVAAHSQADASLINATLVGQGLNIYQLGLEQRSLEDVFLQMTGTSVAIDSPEEVGIP